MSLLEALLLDPPRIDVWATPRTDGIVGSGTQTDPYDTSPRLAAKVTINGGSGLTNVGTEATATCGIAHGYNNNDRVVVFGASKPEFNGIFVIYGATSTAFKYRMDAVPLSGGGTAASAQKVLELRFDTVLQTLVGINTCVHLGPGVYPTGGFSEGVGGANLKSGLRIVGAGIDVTRVKLLGTVAAGTRCYAFGHELIASGKPNLVDFCEISDLTIHCGFTPSAGTTTNVVGGIRLMGNHSRVTRVKLSFWGNRSSVTVFGIGLLTGNTDTGSGATDVTGVVNCGIQDCIVVPPQDNTAITGPMNLLHVGGKETTIASSTRAYGLNPYIRTSYVDCGQTTLANTAAAKVYRALSMSWCRGGLVEGNQIHNTFYGGPYSDSIGAYEITVRNNSYRNVATGPCWLLSTTSANGIQKLLIEGNAIELTTVDVIPFTSVPDRYALGVILYDNNLSLTPFGGVVIRNNQVRYLDGATPGSQKGSGCLAVGVASLMVRENVLELVLNPPPVANQTSLSNKLCSAVQYFENRSPAGKLIQGFKEDDGSLYTELATDADDAFIVSILRRGN